MGQINIMTNKQIFKKAILKAEKNGFNVVQYLPALPPMDFFDGKDFILLYAIKEKILFSHEFAKAFWGEKEIKCFGGIIDFAHGNIQTKPSWKLHLLKMVLLPDNKRLKYIEKFLKVER